MSGLVPGAEGEGRMATGYGALDDSWSAMEGEGVFTESRGLEPYYKGVLDWKYAVYGAHEEALNPMAFSNVPLGRQALIGESLGQGAVLAESKMVDVTYRDQPEALGDQVGRQPSCDLWRAEDYGIMATLQQNPLFTVVLVAGVALLGYGVYKKYVRR